MQTNDAPAAGSSTAAPAEPNATQPPPQPAPAKPAAAARRAQKPPSITATELGTNRIVLWPRTFDEVWRMATLFSRAGDMVPECYRDQPDKCSLAIIWGMELGLSPANAIASIVPIKGRAALWGDALLAVAMTSPDYVDCVEEILFEGATPVGYRCTATRRGAKPRIREFTMADAARAKLTSKNDTPWQTYPLRMCMMRARSWALRDTFPDALRGIYSAEEATDIPGEYQDVTPRAGEEQARTRPAAVAGVIEHQENPLNDLSTLQAATTVEDFRGTTQRMAERVRSATPDLSAIVGESQRAPSAPLDEPTPPRRPLTKGQAAMLRVYQDKADELGTTEQDLFDALGDSVHQGNLQRAQTWLQSRIDAAAQNDDRGA